MNELRLYPSGFLGSALVKNTKPIDKAQSHARMFSSSAITSPQAYSASLDVCQIWEAIANGAPEAKTFEFKERIIAVAKAVFGCTYLHDWVSAQHSSPDWNEWNARWIDETLEFVLRDKSRQLSPSNWIAMLASEGGDTSMQETMIVREVFHTRERLGTAYTIEDFILRWLQVDGGIEDLAQSLHVLFGGR